VGSAGALITLAPLFLRGMRDVERDGMALDPPVRRRALPAPGAP
jgi:hypothetical protein